MFIGFGLLRIAKIGAERAQIQKLIHYYLGFYRKAYSVITALSPEFSQYSLESLPAGSLFILLRACTYTHTVTHIYISN